MNNINLGDGTRQQARSRSNGPSTVRQLLNRFPIPRPFPSTDELPSDNQQASDSCQGEQCEELTKPQSNAQPNVQSLDRDENAVDITSEQTKLAPELPLQSQRPHSGAQLQTPPTKPQLPRAALQAWAADAVHKKTILERDATSTQNIPHEACLMTPRNGQPLASAVRAQERWQQLQFQQQQQHQQQPGPQQKKLRHQAHSLQLQQSTRVHEASPRDKRGRSTEPETRHFTAEACRCSRPATPCEASPGEGTQAATTPRRYRYGMASPRTRYRPQQGLPRSANCDKNSAERQEEDRRPVSACPREPSKPSCPAPDRRPTTAPFSGRASVASPVKRSATKNIAAPPSRSTFSQAKPLTARASTVKFQQGSYELDSEESTDEEAEELRAFWRVLRASTMSAASNACSRTLTPSTLTKDPFFGCTEVEETRQSQSSRTRTSTGIRDMSAREMLSQISPTSPKAGPLRNSSTCPALNPSSLCKRPCRCGSKLWHLPEEVSLQVLCFISTTDICELATACNLLRSFCCVSRCSTGFRWRLVSPHLQVGSANCSDLLEKVWLPRAMWLEARDLSAKASRGLFTALDGPGDKVCRSLLSIDLRNTKVENPAAVAKLVRNNGNLTTLQLGRTRLKDGGAAFVMRSLVVEPLTGELSPHRSLKLLTLEENGLTCLSGPGIANAVIACHLKALVLARNELGDLGLKALAEALAENGRGRANLQLERLDVSENGVTATGMSMLLESLSGDHTLQSLDLGGNEQIGFGLADDKNSQEEQFASTFSSVKGLRDLHLWRCGLADAACAVLVDSKPASLMLLNLAANPFSAALRNRLLRSSLCGPGGALRL